MYGAGVGPFLAQFDDLTVFPHPFILTDCWEKPPAERKDLTRIIF
jgi:hypothetical protein